MVSVKGQVEVIGLLIIVILIALIGLFYVRFSVFNEDVKDNSILSLKANNLVNAISKADTDEGSMKELILNCCSNSCLDLEAELDKVFESIEEEVVFVADCGYEYDPGNVLSSTSSSVSSTGILVRDGSRVSEVYVKIYEK